MSNPFTKENAELAKKSVVSGASYVNTGIKSGASYVGTGLSKVGSAGLSGFKSLLEHHKIHGVVFIITTIVLLIISIIDMANTKWGDVTDEEKRNRDITISTFAFTLILFFYMFWKEYNYLPIFPSFLKLA